MAAAGALAEVGATSETPGVSGLGVRVFLGERQAHWFEGLESTFEEIGGVPETVLLGNTRALVKQPSVGPIARRAGGSSGSFPREVVRSDLRG